MHTVVTELCSGCDLCVAPCPVDCIEMLPAKEEDVWDAARADAARERFDRRRSRREREGMAQRSLNADPDAGKKRALIRAAIARARARRQHT
jgi:electron transport complex protein RnfB